MTPRELLINVLGQASTGSLDARFPDMDVPTIADYVLACHTEELLHRVADDYERSEADKFPGAIYGAIRRIRAYKVGAYLRARADAATEESTR